MHIKRCLFPLFSWQRWQKSNFPKVFSRSSIKYGLISLQAFFCCAAAQKSGWEQGVGNWAAHNLSAKNFCLLSWSFASKDPLFLCFPSAAPEATVSLMVFLRAFGCLWVFCCLVLVWGFGWLVCFGFSFVGLFFLCVCVCLVFSPLSVFLFIHTEWYM